MLWIDEMPAADSHRGPLALLALSLGVALSLGCHHLRPRGDAEWSEAPPPPAAEGSWGDGYGYGYGYGYGGQTWASPGGYPPGTWPAPQPAPAQPWGTQGAPEGASTRSWPDAGAAGGSPPARQPAPAASPQPAPVEPGPGLPPLSPLATRAVAFARAQLGKPYCYGGTGPQCFDCSGFTYAAWRWAGKPVPRTSSDQRDQLVAIPWVVARPGDIVWRPGHVGLYVGDGWVIHSPETGKRVGYEPARKYEMALRP